MIILSMLHEPLMLIVWLFAVVVVLTVHEFCHALASTLLGDNTAKMAGRLTLNPASHLSFMGFLMLLLVGFGWGNPVPYNQYNLKYSRLGPALVAIAGPLSNLVLAIFSIIFLKVVTIYQLFPPDNLLINFFNLFVVINIVLALFNMLPIPPLDGSKILFATLSAPRFNQFRDFMEERGPYILLIFIMADQFLGLNLFSSLVNKVLELIYSLISA